jgi:hypothetical protein
MVEDKIALILKDLAKLKEELRELKKDQKQQEKLDTQEYLEIKRVFNDLKKQKKDAEEVFQQDLAGDSDYQKNRELKVKKEEEIATLNQKLFAAISTLPPKPFTMNVEMEAGPVKVQIMPEMRLYINGREEKKRIM